MSRPKVLFTIGVFLVTAALLSGCAAQAPVRAAATPSTQPSTLPTQSSPSPTPTATPTPTTNPDDPSAWVIGFGGVGPLVLGGSLKAAQPSMTAYQLDQDDSCWMSIYSSSADPIIWVAHPASGSSLISFIAVGDGSNGSKTFGVGSPKTSKGIGIGSSRSSVLAAYPGVPEHQGVNSTYITLTDGAGHYILIQMMSPGGPVVAITVQNDDQYRDEYCG